MFKSSDEFLNQRFGDFLDSDIMKIFLEIIVRGIKPNKLNLNPNFIK